MREASLEEQKGGWYLKLKVSSDSLRKISTELIRTSTLRKTVTTCQDFTNPDGSAITIDKDYMEVKRNRKRPCPGAFEMQKEEASFLVWKNRN